MLNIIRFIKNKEKYNSLDEKFKAIGITVSGFEYLKPSMWQDIYDTLCDLLKIYNFIPTGYLNNIIAVTTKKHLEERYKLLNNDTKIQKKNLPIAETGFIPKKDWNGYCYTNHVRIILNVEFIRHITKELSVIKNPKNHTKFLIAHEFGHIIDIFCSSLKDGIIKMNTPVNSFIWQKVITNLSFSKEIVDSVIMKKYGELNYTYAINEIGNLSELDHAELFAETIALNYMNISVKLSIQIYDVFIKTIKG